MYKYFFIILSIVISYQLNAKPNDSVSNDNVQTLLGNSRLKLGFFGGPEVKATQVNGGWGVMTGGKGGLILNNLLVIGGGGYGLSSTNERTIDSKFAKINLGYGGVYLEYINSSNSLVHFTVNAMIGGGSASYSFDRLKNLKAGLIDSKTELSSPSSSFFVFEPGVNAELNITKFLRLCAGVSYRITSGLSLKGTGAEDINGPSANLSFKIGDFSDIKIH